MNEEISRALSDIAVKIQQLADTNERQNARIDKLEKMQENLTQLTISVKELTLEVKNLVSEISSHGDRIQTLEKRDGEMWRKVIGGIVVAIVGGLVGLAFSKFGLG